MPGATLPWIPLSRWALGLLAWLSLIAVPALADDGAPGRVGRLADFSGEVSVFDQEQGNWTSALRNRPLTTGDRVSTARDARAELRIGSTTLRLGSATEFEVIRLDDDRLRFQLHTGSLALRVRSREVAAELEIETTEARMRPLRGGHFRIDRQDDTTYAGSWRGELRIEAGNDSFDVDTGRRVELWREGPSRQLRQAWTTTPDDAFAAWVSREDRLDDRSVSARYVSPETTGIEELDRNGRWEQHPEYGALWVPDAVAVDWAPYRFGHWTWLRPWGWTWVDDARWGFAPFHYGRWVHWRGRWGWVPGPIMARPVFAPALVAWIGGPHLGLSISIGGPSLGWVPLAPYEPYRPHYPIAPRHRDHFGQPLPRVPGGAPRQPPTGPVMYSNQGVPGGVTVVPASVLEQHRQPVQVVRHLLKDEGGSRDWQRQPLAPVQPPAAGSRDTRTAPTPSPGRVAPESISPMPPNDRTLVEPVPRRTHIEPDPAVVPRQRVPQEPRPRRPAPGEPVAPAAAQPPATVAPAQKAAPPAPPMPMPMPHGQTPMPSKPPPPPPVEARPPAPKEKPQPAEERPGRPGMKERSQLN